MFTLLIIALSWHRYCSLGDLAEDMGAPKYITFALPPMLWLTRALWGAEKAMRGHTGSAPTPNQLERV